MSLEKNRRISLYVVEWPSFLTSPPSKDLGVWRTKSGGSTTADLVRDYPGGMEEEELLAAAPQGEEVTLQRTFKLNRDIQLRAALRASVSYIRIEIHDQHLDPNKQPYGSAEVSVGPLLGYNPPDADAGSNDLATVELTIGVPAGGITS